MSNTPKASWDECLSMIEASVSDQQFNTWFRPLTFESFDDSSKILLVQVPSSYVYEYLEEHYVELLGKVLTKSFGKGVKLRYRLAKEVQPKPEPKPDDFDTRLKPGQTFSTYIEGDSNKLARSVGLSIAEHPNTTQFNPMFIYGPSGCGKTHLLNAIGLRTHELYPRKRVLYVDAREFQSQYIDSVLNNTTNDFISFYQTIDVLLVDDIQEWVSAAKTQETFFHVFNHLFRNGKRIVLACDRPPVELKGMSDRLLTRFSCGVIAELEKPNVQLCVDILNSKIKRDGLSIPADVVNFIANTANGSVRDLEGVVASLLAYSIVYNGKIDMRLAERVIKRAVNVDDKPLTIDDILEKVCNHFNVSATAVASRSRKRDYVVARQVSMYLAKKYTNMPSSRIGKLIGGRDHSTVIHSCSQVETRVKIDRSFADDVASIERAFKLKRPV